MNDEKKIPGASRRLRPRDVRPRASIVLCFQSDRRGRPLGDLLGKVRLRPLPPRRGGADELVFEGRGG